MIRLWFVAIAAFLAGFGAIEPRARGRRVRGLVVTGLRRPWRRRAWAARGRSFPMVAA